VREQAKMYMLANGADPDSIDEISFRKICIMYADGQIGNRAIVETLGSLTTAVYNYMRYTSRPAYTLKDAVGDRFLDYIYPPKDKTEAVNNSLLSYMVQARGFKKDRFKGA